jgi:hypothetical protein
MNKIKTKYNVLAMSKLESLSLSTALLAIPQTFSAIMKQEIVDYILNYFNRLMNERETLAWRHYSSEYKLTHSENPDSVEKIRKIYLSKGWLTEDEQTLRLLENGIDHFRLKTAERILKENREKIDFNNCPKCRELARTPNAKQCRFCGHDWHNE